jgi:ketosteroid isomerase-like protein
VSDNLDLVRSIYANWERGDWSSVDWAHPEIEFVQVDGPDPSRAKGVAEMASAWRTRIGHVADVGVEVEEYRELDATRVLVLVRNKGVFEASGVDVEKLGGASIAAVFAVTDGKVTCLSLYWDRDRAVADLGLKEWAESQGNVEMVERAVAAINARDIEGYLACCTENVRLETPMAAVGGVYEGTEGIRRYFADIEDTAPNFRIELDGVEGVDGKRVIAFLRTSGMGRASGILMAPPPFTNVYDLLDGKLSRIRIFLDREEALKAAGLKE